MSSLAKGWIGIVMAGQVMFVSCCGGGHVTLDFAESLVRNGTGSRVRSICTVPSSCTEGFFLSCSYLIVPFGFRAKSEVPCRVL